jgi:hypothetical protein
MCDFNDRLIAWLDNELPENEAAEVERHLKECSECRERLDAYKRVGASFSAYRDAFSASAVTRVTPRWRLAAIGAGAIAAALLLVLMLHQPRPTQRQARDIEQVARKVGSTAEAPVASENSSKTAPIREPSTGSVRHKNLVSHGNKHNVALLFPGPEMRVAIPADSVLPPGAAPPGTVFLFDFSIGADGSAQGARLRPELTGFERRPIQP